MDATIGGRSSVYQVLKPSPGTEPYVAVTIQFAAQRVTAGLQMGCLPLEVETGRYTPNPHMRGEHASCAERVWRTKNTLLSCPCSPATRLKSAFQSSAGPQLYQ